VALDANAKGILLLALILFWAGRKSPAVLASFLLWFGAGLGAMSLNGSLGGYYRQVWEFGRLYAKDSFVADPLREGVLRSLHWLGFHAALVIAAGVAWKVSSRRSRLKFLVWLVLAGASVVAGERFFPRYYLALLPPLVLLGARGMTRLTDAKGLFGVRMRRALLGAVVVAAVVPVVRFGPRYFILAADELTGKTDRWADVALNRDSQFVASQVVALVAGPSRSVNPSGAKADLLVWGYRPDLFVYTRLPAAMRFLDSQLLTGVIADRHLTQTHVSVPEAAQNRLALTTSHPLIIVDGLGLLNPALGIERYPELRSWLAAYEVVLRTPYSIVYKRKQKNIIL
jgi:hypothetical protein